MPPVLGQQDRQDGVDLGIIGILGQIGAVVGLGAVEVPGLHAVPGFAEAGVAELRRGHPVDVADRLEQEEAPHPRQAKHAHEQIDQRVVDPALSTPPRLADRQHEAILARALLAPRHRLPPSSAPD